MNREKFIRKYGDGIGINNNPSSRSTRILEIPHFNGGGVGLDLYGDDIKIYKGDWCLFDQEREDDIENRRPVRLNPSEYNFDNMGRPGQWAYEIWEGYYGDQLIYKKNHTLKNTYTEYDNGKFVMFSEGRTYSADKDKIIKDQRQKRSAGRGISFVPLLDLPRKGCTDIVYMINTMLSQTFEFCCVEDLMLPGAMVSQRYHAYTDSDIIEKENRMPISPIVTEYDGFGDVPKGYVRSSDFRIIFSKHMQPYNNFPIANQIRDFFAHNILTAGANISGLFNSGDYDYSAYTAWMISIPNYNELGHLDEQPVWIFNIGKSTAEGYNEYVEECKRKHHVLGGVMASGSTGNNNIHHMRFNIQDNYISMCDGMFSNLSSLKSIKLNFIDGEGTRLASSGKMAQGFIPSSATYMFGIMNMTQSMLDEVLTNCLWNECRNIAGMFSSFNKPDKINKFTNAEDYKHMIWKCPKQCQPFEETPENTIRLGYHPLKETNINYTVTPKNRNSLTGMDMVDEINNLIYNQNYYISTNYFEDLHSTFQLSGIERVEVVIDAEFVDKVNGGEIDYRGYSYGGGYFNGVQEIRIKNIGNYNEYNLCYFSSLSKESIEYAFEHTVDRRHPEKYPYMQPAELDHFKNPTNIEKYVYATILMNRAIIPKLSKEDWQQWAAKLKEKLICPRFFIMVPIDGGWQTRTVRLWESEIRKSLNLNDYTLWNIEGLWDPESEVYKKNFA